MKANPSDDIAITYADFKLLAHVEDPNNWEPGIKIDSAGIWVEDQSGQEHLTRGERHVLEQHPDGDTRKTVVTFPCTLGDLRKRLLPTIGEGWLDPFELADFIAEQRPRAASKWPWGEHETKLLCALAAACNRYWKNYDPADTTTAPANADVVTWLKDELHVSKQSATAIATIVRHDEAPSGRRSKK